MILKNKKPFTPNRPQLLSSLNNAKLKVHMWGRGTGKTTDFAFTMQKAAHEMPRGNWVIVGRTFGQLQTIVIPEIIFSLERLGYFKDVHYVIGSLKGVKMGFPEAFRMPLKAEHMIHWYTGAIWVLVSQDREGSGRGYNISGIMADEGLTLLPERFRKEVVAANRGQEKIKGWKSTLVHSIHISSSKPTGSIGKWLLELGDYYQNDDIDYDLLHKKIAELQYQYVASKDKAERAHLARQFIALKKKLRYYVHDDPEDPDFQTVYYDEANAFDNIKFLGIKYLEQQFKVMTKIEFLVEILNLTIKEIEDGFYAAFNELQHSYESYNDAYLNLVGWDFLDRETREEEFADCRKDGDVNLNEPLDLSGDYGYYLNCLTVSQEHRETGFWEYRYLNAFWKKPPALIDEVVEAFCHYYRFHNKRVVNYYYDQTAISKDGRQLSYKEMVVKTLVDNGWTVNEFYLGQVPTHETRYKLWSKAYSGDGRLPMPMYNRKNCKYLILALQLAGVIQGKNGFEKDKRPERNHDIPQEETTHLTDAHDTPFYARFVQFLERQTEFIDNYYG